MKISVSKSAGFCFGVRRAIDIATRSPGHGSPICMLGDIVHNEFVVESLRGKGIKKIKRLGKGSGKTLLIRAHGAPLRLYTAAREAGYSIIDATCPMVREIQNIAKKEAATGRTIIIVGDKDHDEVLGIKGSVPGGALVIDPASPLPLKKLASVRKAAVVVQSTQDPDTVAGINKKLSEVVRDMKLHDTVCNPTKKRQKDAKTMPLENDVIVVIGSKTSANTRRLYEISSSLNPRTCLIGSSKDLKKSFFKDARSVGVLAGASTPDDIIRGVVRALGRIGSPKR